MVYDVSLLLQGEILVVPVKSTAIDVAVRESKASFYLSTRQEHMRIGDVIDQMLDVSCAGKRDGNRIKLLFSGWARMHVQASNQTDVIEFMDSAEVNLSLAHQETGDQTFKVLDTDEVEIEVEEIERVEEEETDDDDYHRPPPMDEDES